MRHLGTSQLPNPQKVNMYTVKVEDADFAASYKLKVKRNQAYLQTVVCWFDSWFNACHRPILLSTAPYKDYNPTHWKQCSFFCKESLPVHRGDFITGSVAVKKSPDNKRFLNTKISFHVKTK